MMLLQWTKHVCNSVQTFATEGEEYKLRSPPLMFQSPAGLLESTGFYLKQRCKPPKSSGFDSKGQIR